ncbi:unnamed protein product [Closterium sp. NIES-53]
MVSRLLATVVTDPFFESTAASALVAELVDFATACRLDYAIALVAEFESANPLFVKDTPTPRSYAKAITGPYSSQWKAAMDAETASWKSTGTYVDAVHPSRANIVDGMWIFRVKWPSGSPPAFKACYVARGFIQRRGVEYFLTFSPTPKMTHSLGVAARRCSALRRPDYGLHLAPCEWHDTQRTTLAALGFTPSTADPSLSFIASASSSPYHSPLLFLPATCSQLHLRTSPMSGMGLVLGGRGLVVLTGHADASWVENSATQRSSQGYTFSLGSGFVSWRSTRSSSGLSSCCEAEIYAGAIAHYLT